jgi:hypothetical protein
MMFISEDYMKRLLLCFLVLLTTLLSGNASAGQSAELVCVQKGTYTLGTNMNISGYILGCITYELRVTVTSDGDAGQPGAFGIGARLNSGLMAFWTMNGGWGPYNSALIPPVDTYYAALPPTNTYTIFHGTLEDLCQLSRFQSFSIYAGHGILSPEKVSTINDLKQYGSNIPTDHLRRVFIQMDAMTKNSGKTGLVYSHDCNIGMGI